MPSDIRPFRMADGLYFVGTCKASSHLIDTGDGLILIDAGYEYTAPIILESIKELGFDPADVKLILLTHGHRDHSGGVPELLRHCKAKVYLSELDRHYLDECDELYTPDCDYSDGGVITLGHTSITTVFTPGHTEGTYSFFFDVTENGRVYRAGTFGGAGTNQLKKPYLDKRKLPYQNRRLFYESLEKLKKEKVDLFIGNHAWHNHTREYGELIRTTGENRFLDSTVWLPFLEKLEKTMTDVIAEESRSLFVVYAHRGASSYNPENTLMSFYDGVKRGANGVETDVRRTKDGTLVLFHDDTLTRVTGAEGSISDYTLDELNAFPVKKFGLSDRIPTFEDFLEHFAWRDLTFAIELKAPGVEADTVDLIRKYGIEGKTIVTSFRFDHLVNVKKLAPAIRCGWLTSGVDDAKIEKTLAAGFDEICPKAVECSPEKVAAWHKLGLRVRAWGVSDEDVMKAAYDAGCDGMTVNFPDKLVNYIATKQTAEHPAEP